MNDDAIIEHLRRVGRRATASVVAEELARVPGGLTHGTLVSYFKRAFPAIPLRTLVEAGAWRRVTAGQLSDEGLDDLLRPWLPTSPSRDTP